MRIEDVLCEMDLFLADSTYIPDVDEWRTELVRITEQLAERDAEIQRQSAEIHQLRSEWRIQNACIAGQHDTIAAQREMIDRLETGVLPAVINDPEYAASTIVRQDAEIERLTLQRDAQAENATQWFDRANGREIEAKALRATLNQAAEALDLAQALLERSSHHPKILEAYRQARSALAGKEDKP